MMPNRYANTNWLENGLGNTVSSIVRPLTALDDAIAALTDGDTGFTQFHYAAATELTIEDGAVTITGSHHTIDTEGDAASDVLHTINGGQEGDILYLRLANAARTVTLEHGTDNLYLSKLDDYDLDSGNRTVELFHNGTYWTDSGEANAPRLAQIYPWTVLESAAASVSIPDIPALYNTLILRVAAHATDGILLAQFNDDTTVTNYQSSFQSLIISSVLTSVNNQDLPGINAGNIPHQRIVDEEIIPGNISLRTIVIQNVSAYQPKTLQFINPATHHLSPYYTMNVGGGLWLNTTDLINKITLSCYISGNLGTGSFYALYGVK